MAFNTRIKEGYKKLEKEMNCKGCEHYILEEDREYCSNGIGYMAGNCPLKKER